MERNGLWVNILIWIFAGLFSLLLSLLVTRLVLWHHYQRVEKVVAQVDPNPLRPRPYCGENGIYKVLPRDTLWDIASRCYDKNRTGEWVYVIRQFNPEVRPGALRVGQELRMPPADYLK